MWGRPPSWGALNDKPPRSRRGSGDGMQAHGDGTKHGKPQRREVVALNENSVRSRLGRLGWRTGSYYCRSRVMLVEGRSLTFGALLEETNSPEIGFVPINSTKD
jgi:hypothetical protein